MQCPSTALSNECFTTLFEAFSIPGAPGSLGPGAWGAGAATLACQKKTRKSSHQTRGIEKSGKSPGPQDSGAGVARAWRGRGAGYRPLFGVGGAGVARAWRGRGAGVARACPVTPGAWGGHAGLPKITKIISSDTGNRKKLQVIFGKI
eukprot:gene14154-biopygen5093